MPKNISVTEFQRNLPAIFDEVVRLGAPLVLTRRSRPEAALILY